MSSLKAERSQDIVVSRDWISALPDELLIHILLLISTKDAVSTMVLSKRWRLIWTMVPKLEYIDTDDECESLRRLLDKSIELHKAPVLETLCIRLGEKCPINIDIEKWVSKAVSRFVRKLDLELLWAAEPTSLPKSLYTCKTLVELNLSGQILVDVPSSVCLPSLKILRLLRVVYKEEDSLFRLLSSCSVLDQSNVVFLVIGGLKNDRFVMANVLRYAMEDILVLCSPKDKFLSSTSLSKSLYSSLRDPLAMNFSGITFSRLRELILRPYHHFWLDHLQQILKNSPKLWKLRIITKIGYRPGYLPLPPSQPSSVPKCLSNHLKVFEWIEYGRNDDEEELIRYILANSKCFIKTRITLRSTFNLEEKEMIKKELKSMFRGSTISQLLFE